jgi:hypothetical protein
MHKSNFYFLSILSFFLSFSINAQTSFSASPQLITAYQSANIFVFYSYTQFENLTNDTLQMRWIRTKIEGTQSIGQGGGGNSAVWDIAVQDPNNFYMPANKLDSADFFLPPITGSTDKFILQLFPNMAAGDLYAEFMFFPIENPTDTLTVVFDYTAFDPTTTATNYLEKDSFMEIFPNPTTDFVFLRNNSYQKIKIGLLNSNGKILDVFDMHENEFREFNLTRFNKGIYFVKIEKEGKIDIQKIIRN